MKLFLIYNNKNFDLPSIQVNKIIKLVIIYVPYNMLFYNCICNSLCKYESIFNHKFLKLFYYRKSILLFLLLIKISYIYKIKIVQIKSKNCTCFFKYRNIDFIFSFFLNRDVSNLLIKILDRYFN